MVVFVQPFFRVFMIFNEKMYRFSLRKGFKQEYLTVIIKHCIIYSPKVSFDFAFKERINRTTHLDKRI